MTRRIAQLLVFALPLLVAGPAALAGEAEAPPALPDAPAIAEATAAPSAPAECLAEDVDLRSVPVEDLGDWLPTAAACTRCPYNVGTCDGHPYCYVGNDCCCPAAGICNCVCW